MSETKRSGSYELSCGHTIKASLDIEQRQKCPMCGHNAIVLRVIR